VIEIPTPDPAFQTVSDYFADWLVRRGIERVFTLPGGMIAPLLDAIYRRGVQIVTMHHEQGVAFAADGVGRYTATPGVALATAGPGATNMLTAIGSAYLDSVPSVFLTGQVQSYLLKGERPVRQYGFQECDVVAMATPVTKAAWRAGAGSEVPDLLDEAFELAISGRPGPVLLELPSDIQTAAVPAGRRPRAAVPKPSYEDSGILAAILADAAAARRPLALLGGGVQAAGAAERCRQFLERLGIPAATSVTALDVLSADHPLRLGMIGMYGNRWVNLAVEESDFVLVLGSRLDFGTLGADVAGWASRRTVYQVDCDPGEMQRVRGVHPIEADLGAFLDAAADTAKAAVASPDRTEWARRLAGLRAQWPDEAELAGCPGINPNVLMQELSAVSGPAAAFVVDAGQHLWWACQSIRPAAGQRFLPALGMGPCGWALPAAVGVAHASGRPVVLICGDGAFQFNIQELQTVVRDRLPVKIVLVDNGCHGSVRQLQEAAFEGRYPSTVLGYSAPDFVAVADAYGLDAATVEDPSKTAEALRWLWRDPDRPALLQVRISQELNVYPNVAFGAPLTRMESYSPTPAAVRHAGADR